MQIGFIGAGLMGHGMAANLLKAGHGEKHLSRLLDPRLNQD